MTQKSIADYSATEAAQEIRSIAGEGTRIDLLAGQLLILTLNAESRLSNYRESQRVANNQLMNLYKNVNNLLQKTHGRKTIQRQDLDMIFRSNKI